MDLTWWPGVAKLPTMTLGSSKVVLRSLCVGSALTVLGCHVQMQAQSSLGSTSSGSGSASSTSAPKRTKKPKSSSASHGHGASWSFHESGKVSGHVEWHGRSGRVCRSTAPFRFVGMAKLAGSAHLNPNGSLTASGNAEASGKSSGGANSAQECAAPRSDVPKTPPPTPVKAQPAKEPVKKPQFGSDVKAPPKKPQFGSDSKPAPPAPQFGSDSKPAPGPTPTELEKPIDPPAEAPPNVFGYPTPVRGCFEGQVFPLAPDAPKLPSDYSVLKPVSVLYACEWDIPPRAWDQGFPGVADRFEWFAIRYAGAFHLGVAGEYGFRLSSDDGTKLVIDGKLVIDNDGQHPPKEASGKLQLSAGDHEMTLEYFQGPRYQINLQLWVTPPGKPEELFTVR